MAVASALSAQFANRETQRTYLALVCGIPLVREGTVQTGIARDPANRKRMTAVAQGISLYRMYSLFHIAVYVTISCLN